MTLSLLKYGFGRFTGFHCWPLKYLLHIGSQNSEPWKIIIRIQGSVSSRRTCSEKERGVQRPRGVLRKGCIPFILKALARRTPNFMKNKLRETCGQSIQWTASRPNLGSWWTLLKSRTMLGMTRPVWNVWQKRATPILSCDWCRRYVFCPKRRSRDANVNAEIVWLLSRRTTVGRWCHF